MSKRTICGSKEMTTIVNLPTPTTLPINFKIFLGVVGFYQRYFRIFVNKVIAMCKLLKNMNHSYGMKHVIDLLNG
jgi:hypothetical protein